MRFRNRIILSNLVAILIPFLLFSILSGYNFQKSFNSYLEYEESVQFHSIEKIINKILNSDFTFEEKQILLREFITAEQLEIKYFSSSGEVLIDISAIPYSNTREEENIVIKEYPLISEGAEIGSLQIGYLEENYNKVISDSFQSSIINFFLLSILTAIITSFVINYYIATQLSKPINALSIMTNQIREGEFDKIKSLDSDIYEIENLSNDIKYLATSLEHQKTIRKNYAQDISHELRTPITNLQLHIEAINDGIIEPSSENFQSMMNEINRLNTIIVDLKESFDGSIKDHVNLSTFLLYPLLSDVFLSIHPSFIKENVTFVLEEGERLEITTDRDKLSQILINLLTNALKASQPGGKVLLCYKHLHEKVLISVKDNGIGIPEEDLGQIFNRFYRVDNVRNTKISGSGLGLSIVKNYVTRLGGKILVNSKVDVGTEFILEFPDSSFNVSEFAEQI